VVTPNTGLVVSIAGTPTVEAITEAAAANGGAPPGALVKCFLTLAKDKKVFSAAAKAGITYKCVTRPHTLTPTRTLSSLCAVHGADGMASKHVCASHGMRCLP
jgi:hypothetical protein